MGLDFLSRGFRCLLGLSPWGSAAGEAEIQRTRSKGGRFRFNGRARARSQCVHSTVRIVTQVKTALRLAKSQASPDCSLAWHLRVHRYRSMFKFRFIGQFGKCIVMQP